MAKDRTEQMNLRIDSDLVRQIEGVAEEEALDRSTTVRRLLRAGLMGWREDRAIMAYQTGALSIGRAAEVAGLTQWELMDRLRARRVAHPLTAEDVDEWFSGQEGYRTTLDWMGESVTTLADIPPAPGRILLVGISPVPASVDAGHYYQGSIGRRLWGRLERAGLLRDPIPGREDEAFERSGHGITDVVKRVLAKGEVPSRDELEMGADRVRGRIETWEPGLVLFAFKKAARAVLGADIAPGPGPRIHGAPTFLLPGPFEERSRAEAVLEGLAAWETRLHLFN